MIQTGDPPQAPRSIRNIADELTRQQMFALVQSADDAIVMKSLQGVIQSWNPAAERLLGYCADEVIGLNVSILIPEDRLEEEAMILNSIRAGVRVAHFETTRRRRDGTFIDVSLTISPVYNSEGQVIGASEIMRDITEQNAFLRRVQMLNANLEGRISARTAASEFRVRELIARLETVRTEERDALAVILHDGIAQDLLAVNLNLRHLKNVGTAEQRALFETVRQEFTQAITKCMADVRQVISELRPLTSCSTDLGSLILRHAERFTQSADLDLQMAMGDDFPSLPERLQVLFFRAAQEALTNVARHAQASTVAISLWSTEGRIGLSVADNGRGLIPGSRQKERSLGLFSLRERFAAEGGDLMLTPQQPRGTLFTVFLPRMLAESGNRIPLLHRQTTH